MKRIFCVLVVVFLSACTPKLVVTPSAIPVTTTTTGSAETATIPPIDTPIPSVTPTIEPTLTPEPTPEFLTISFLNGKGGTVSIYKISGFETSIEYIAKHARWISAAESDRNENLRKWYQDTPELDAILSQFEGVPGYRGKDYCHASGLPYPYYATIQKDFYFNLWRGPVQGGILLVFQDNEGHFVAVLYPDTQDLEDYEKLIHNDPIMSNLHP